MHELGPEPNFNESMYFNAYDPQARLGGFFRLGNRANEGAGEMTICLYLPDGRVADRRERVRTLIECPQPLVSLLASRFATADEGMRKLMLEALTWRYYRIRDRKSTR